MTAPYPLLPVLDILSGFAVLLVLPWKLHSWNVGICSYIIWLSSLCFFTGINAIIWKDNVDDVAPVWCEVSIRLMIGSSFALPSCSLSMVRRLYLSTRTTGVMSTKSTSRRRQVLADLAICFLLPLILVALSVIFQGHRYDIFEQVGCVIPIVNCIPAILILNTWPVILGLLSIIYSSLVLRTVLKHRKELNQMLDSSASEVDRNLFYRVFALTSTTSLFPMLLGVLVIFSNTREGVGPYVNWDWVHWGFSRVDKYPIAQYDPYRLGGWDAFSRVMLEWIYIFCAVVFMLVFGTSKNLFQYYSGVFWDILRWCGVKRKESPSRSTVQTIQFATDLGVSSSINSSETHELKTETSKGEGELSEVKHESV